MADINAIAKQFTDFYYSQFDTDRAGLRSLYVSGLPSLISAIFITMSENLYLR